MENASKALLIAGAIIVVLVIIAIGMLILNSTTGIFNRATSAMSDKEKTLFNQTFTMYEGEINGSQLKALIQEVITNNNNDNNQKVTINGFEPTRTNYYGGSEEGINPVQRAATYKVEINLYDAGLVKDINVEHD